MCEAKGKPGGKAALRVIRGGGLPRGLRGPSALKPPPPRHPGPEELAADMAEIFALSLLRDLPAEALGQPHRETRVDRGTVFTQHELLCELRSLPWFDARATEVEGRGIPARRRALCFNAEGQFTLRMLLRSGVALEGDGRAASALWAEDHESLPAKPRPRPEARDPISDWLTWCAGQSGACLRWAGTPAADRVANGPQAITTPGALAEALPQRPPARVFHNVVLAALARGRLSMAPPAAHDLWTGPRLLALMAEAEARAARMVARQEALRGGLARPAVTAARMTLWLGREEQEPRPPHATYREAAERLAHHAPRLLHWVSRANAARRGLRRPGLALFLPLAGVRCLEYGPAETEAHLVIAAALASLLKAVLYRDPRGLGRIGSGAAAPAAEADLLVRDIARARVVAAACLPSEAFAQIRLGEAIALQLLREALEEDNRSASLGLRDFDGRALVLQANPRHVGRGLAQLRADGRPVAWPQDSAPPAAHLTRVV